MRQRLTSREHSPVRQYGFLSRLPRYSLCPLTALRPNPWYDPRYAIPLLGMILGNCMTGIALGLDTLTTSLVSRHAGVEAQR
ncbi:MAG TPA: ABC transporter permease [Bradyrhizobium sp.]|uniref:ABC transporter permease n=1 Tax=Bradyrhizobium sp. TaxID=376 RepID=UPI002B7B00E9|nr:ABC transporter permease [Bradyrhizobium sp.]HXB77948.1 ABC transporter permease [Bradyrhizobium sp.]